MKLLVLTEDGEWMRSEITKRMAEPPAPIASLSEKDQRALRDILKRALESVSDESDARRAGRNRLGSPRGPESAPRAEAPASDRRPPARPPEPRGGTRGTRVTAIWIEAAIGIARIAPRIPKRVLPKSTATRTMNASIFVARFWICGWIT